MAIKHKIIIPPGYKERGDWINENPGLTPDETLLRWYRGHYAYVFEPENELYRAFLDKCRQDTKSLRIALNDEIKKANLPFFTEGKGNPSRIKTYRKIKLLIRPPYLTSANHIEKNASNRMQGDEDQDVFILHFDEVGSLQTVRFWRSKKKGKRRD